MSERNGARERSEQCGAGERVSSASKRASTTHIPVSGASESLCFPSFVTPIVPGNANKGDNGLFFDVIALQCKVQLNANLVLFDENIRFLSLICILHDA